MATINCATCGREIDESEAMFGDAGMICDTCQSDAEVGQMWNGQVIASIAAALVFTLGAGGCGACVGPMSLVGIVFFGLTIGGVVAAINCIRLYRAPDESMPAPISPTARTFALVAGILGVTVGTLSILWQLFLVVAVVTTM